LDRWFLEADRGDLVVLNVLVEDRSFQPADVADADQWRRRLDLTIPTLADAQGAWVSVWGDLDSATFNQHSYTLVGADGIVIWREEENRRAGPVLERIIAQLEML
jgi:hypothetical protein